MYTVALWGAGKGYNVFSSLKSFSSVKVSVIVDNNNFCKSIDGIPVISPKDIDCVPYDFIVITVVNEYLYAEILNEALGHGISREKILPLRVFEIPFFNFDDYVKLLRSNISILSDSCLAGYIYHKFGMKFMTPTINMFTDNENYLRFLMDIRKYLNEHMTEKTDYFDKPFAGIYSYPRGKIGDVEWIFNHDVTFNTAKARWDKGVKRFNYNNYIAIMTLYSEEAARKFSELPIKNKMGFFWEDLGIDCIVYMPEWNDPQFRAKFGYSFTQFVNAVATEENGIYAINWLKALLHEDGYRRKQYVDF